MTHICVGKLATIASDNGLSPGRHQAIIWTNAGILLIWSLGTNFSEFKISIEENAFENIVCEMAAIVSRPQCVNSIYTMKRLEVSKTCDAILTKKHDIFDAFIIIT